MEVGNERISDVVFEIMDVHVVPGTRRYGQDPSFPAERLCIIFPRETGEQVEDSADWLDKALPAASLVRASVFIRSLWDFLTVVLDGGNMNYHSGEPNDMAQPTPTPYTEEQYQDWEDLTRASQETPPLRLKATFESVNSPERAFLEAIRASQMNPGKDWSLVSMTVNGDAAMMAKSLALESKEYTNADLSGFFAFRPEDDGQTVSITVLEAKIDETFPLVKHALEQGEANLRKKVAPGFATAEFPEELQRALDLTVRLSLDQLRRQTGNALIAIARAALEGVATSVSVEKDPILSVANVMANIKARKADRDAAQVTPSNVPGSPSL